MRTQKGQCCADVPYHWNKLFFLSLEKYPWGHDSSYDLSRHRPKGLRRGFNLSSCLLQCCRASPGRRNLPIAGSPQAPLRSSGDRCNVSKSFASGVMYEITQCQPG